MGWLTKAAKGAVRGAGGIAGRTLSRHVLPDTLIPSWKTQRTFSRAGSTISRGLSSLVRKRKTEKQPARREQPKAYRSPALAGVRLGASPSNGARSMGKATNYPAHAATSPHRSTHDVSHDGGGNWVRPAPAHIPMSAARRDLMSGPSSIRGRAKPPRTSSPTVRPQYQQTVRPAVANEPVFNKNAWSQGRSITTSSEWYMPPTRAPRKVPASSRVARNTGMRSTARRRNLAEVRRSVTPRKPMWYDFD